MRIVGGKYKGRIFNPGKSFRSRPTTDFGKESLFNILENRITWEETDTLDLFSGTGSISFEFVSRGCRRVIAVELDFVHCRFIRKTAETLGIQNLTVIRNDVFHYLSRGKSSFDLVFADPPHTLANFQEIAGKVLKSDVLKPGGLFILEHPKAFSFVHLPGFFEIRKYGSIHFSFFRKGMDERLL